MIHFAAGSRWTAASHSAPRSFDFFVLLIPCALLRGLPRRVPLLAVSIFLFFLFRALCSEDCRVAFRSSQFRFFCSSYSVRSAQRTAASRSAPRSFDFFVLLIPCALLRGLPRRVPLLAVSIFLFFLFRALCSEDCRVAFRSSQFRFFCSSYSVRSAQRTAASRSAPRSFDFFVLLIPCALLRGLPRRVPLLAVSIFLFFLFRALCSEDCRVAFRSSQFRFFLFFQCVVVISRPQVVAIHFIFFVYPRNAFFRHLKRQIRWEKYKENVSEVNS